MKSWFVGIVVTLAAINLVYFALPGIYVMFGSDLSFSSLFDQGAPLRTALWIHRVSVISVIAVVLALFSLLAKRRFGNAVAALVLVLFVAQMAYMAFIQKVSTGSGSLSRLEYENEGFGLDAEQMAKFAMLALELLLIGVLVTSKRIRKVYGQRERKS